MSDNNFKDNYDSEQIQLYRRKRAEEFKLNISSSSADDDVKVYGKDSQGNLASGDVKSDSNEITSFSNETTRAQIEKESKKAIKAEKREARKVNKIKSGRNKKIYRLAWLMIIILLSAVVSDFFVSGFNDLFAVRRTEEEIVTIIISKGDDAGTISRKLEDKGVIDSAFYFSVFLEVTGKTDEIEPGVYEVATNKDYLGVVNYMRNVDNRKTTITLQFTEGMTVLEVAEQLYDAGVTSDKDKFLQLCNSDNFDEDYEFLTDIPEDNDRLYKLEGYLFPDTYEFYVDEDPVLTIGRFLDNFDVKINETKVEAAGYTETMTIRDLALRSGLTIDELVNRASIVQGESASVEDMYNVSSVIKNRLERGFEKDIHTLGMDSTQFYPYGSLEEIPEDIREGFTSAYETYNSEGLPPGAICSPGLDALTAAVAPNSTNYFYFCHGEGSLGDQTPYYAETFYEHQENLVSAGLA